MYIFVPMARRIINAMPINEYSAYIIINETNEEIPFQCSDKANIKTWVFDDIEETEKESYLFTVEQAREIISFINRSIDANISDFYVTCDGGISRSPAICMALNIIFNNFNHEEQQKQFTLYKYYNRHVFKTIMKASGR